jgi:DNA-binding transcriptional MocR family regulator
VQQNPAMNRTRSEAEVAAEASPTSPDSDALLDLGINLPPLRVGAARLAQTLRALANAPNPQALCGYASTALLQRYQAAVVAWMDGGCGFAGQASERVIACHGARSGLLLCLQHLLPEGGSVLCDAVTYEGFKQLAATLKLELVPLAADAQGCVPEALERAARASGARVWLAALSLQNPLGSVASATRRHALAEVAQRLGLWVVEDDVYAALLSPGAGLSPLAGLLPQRCFLVGSVSKALAPGLAAGWVLAPETEAEALRSRCYALGLSPSLWSARAFCQLLESGDALAIVADMRVELAALHGLARECLGADIVGAVRTPAPQLWLPVPAGRAETLHAELLRRGLRLTPPAAPLLQSIPAPGLRVCLGAAATRAELAQGLRTLRSTWEEIDSGSRDQLL